MYVLYWKQQVFVCVYIVYMQRNVDAFQTFMYGCLLISILYIYSKMCNINFVCVYRINIDIWYITKECVRVWEMNHNTSSPPFCVFMYLLTDQYCFSLDGFIFLIILNINHLQLLFISFWKSIFFLIFIGMDR